MEIGSQSKVYAICLLLSAPLLVLGAYLKFRGLPYPNLVFLIGAVLAMTYTYIGILRIIKTRSYVSKLLWVLAFFFVNWFAGVGLYFTDFRRLKESEPI